MRIRGMQPEDLPEASRIWNQAAEAGEVLFSRADPEYLRRKILDAPDADPALLLAAEAEGQLAGFICGTAKKNFLPGESARTSPGFLTCIFVRPEYRRRGLGSALLARLEDAFRTAGRNAAACSGGNPVNLDWIIPGTPGHDHNNAPGVDEDCAGYPFLLAAGYTRAVSEVAMYLNLADYCPWDGFAGTRARLEAEGVRFGPYDARLGYDYDGMCDRVGSEYWREALRSEIACQLENRPNTDPRFLPNGRIPKGPRPLLAATCDKRIVAQTGPVDVQESGRGFFTGICTDPLYGGRGIGSVLFNLLMQEFIREGAAFSSLFTGENNHAQKIYLRAGFRPVRRFAIMKKNL